MKKAHLCKKCNTAMAVIDDGWFCALCERREERPENPLWRALPNYISAFTNLLIIAGCYWGAWGLCSWIGSEAAKGQAIAKSPHKHLIWLYPVLENEKALQNAGLKYIADKILAKAYSESESVTVKESQGWQAEEVICSDSFWKSLTMSNSVLTLNFNPGVTFIDNSSGNPPYKIRLGQAENGQQDLIEPFIESLKGRIADFAALKDCKLVRIDVSSDRHTLEIISEVNLWNVLRNRGINGGFNPEVRYK